MSASFNGKWKFNGIVWPESTSTVLVVGNRGDGTSPYCYGNGTNDIRKAFTCVDGVGTYNPVSGNCEGGPSPDPFCYDPPYATDHGTHHYPYATIVYAYDANDLVHVRQGDINPSTGVAWKPWDVKPYAEIDITSQMQAKATLNAINSSGSTVAVAGDNLVRSVAYDPALQRMYLSAKSTDSAVSIYAFDISALPAVADTTAPTMTGFTIGAATKQATIPVTLTATDDTAVTGYCISATNSSVGCDWQASITGYRSATSFTGVLYGFARDAAGNVSTGRTSNSMTVNKVGCR
jgi:hypothetical protein